MNWWIINSTLMFILVCELLIISIILDDHVSQTPKHNPYATEQIKYDPDAVCDYGWQADHIVRPGCHCRILGQNCPQFYVPEDKR